MILKNHVSYHEFLSLPNQLLASNESSTRIKPAIVFICLHLSSFCHTATKLNTKQIDDKDIWAQDEVNEGSQYDDTYDTRISPE